MACAIVLIASAGTGASNLVASKLQVLAGDLDGELGPGLEGLET